MKNTVAEPLLLTATIALFDSNDIRLLLLFGNIFLMIVSYDKLKTPQSRINILSQMIHKACKSPPTKIMKHLEGK